MRDAWLRQQAALIMELATGLVAFCIPTSMYNRTL